MHKPRKPLGTGAGPANEDAVTRRLLGAFEEHFGAGASTGQLAVARAPGRVNLMGDHTDYNDGFVLPATIDLAVYVVLRRRRDQQVYLHSLNFEEEVTYPLAEPPVASLPNWARYVAGVTEEVRKRREGLPAGFDGLLFGSVPLGSGLSSSAALEVAVAMGLDALFDLELEAVETAKLCREVEHNYVGVNCGVMDQMAVRLGKAGHALSLDCRSLAYDHVLLPLEEARLVVVDSRVSRELASSKYNERRRECDEAVAYFQQEGAEVNALRDVSPALFEAHRAGLPEPLRSRCRHVVTENQRVVKAAQLLSGGHVEAFGKLMEASHRSLRDDYEVSISELDVLVEEATSVEGVLGARMTGAGFGGCIVCLARPDAIATLESRLAVRYRRQFGRESAAYAIEQNLEAAATLIH